MKNLDYQSIAKEFKEKAIKKEMLLRNIFELRDDLASAEKEFKEKYGKINDNQFNKELDEVEETDLQDALTLILNKKMSKK